MNDVKPNASGPQPDSAGPGPPAENSRVATAAAADSRSARLAFLIQFVLSVAIVGAAVVYLWRAPAGGTDSVPVLVRQPPAVEAIGPGLIRVRSDSALNDKLHVAEVKPSRVSLPTLRVTGTVVASPRPGRVGEIYWQFDDPELLMTFNEWEKVQLDLAFSQEQRERIIELAETRVTARKRVVERMERLVRAGTDTLADLELARTELLEAEIEGRQQVNEAETEVRRAKQEEAVLERQLQLAGLDPELLREATSDVDLVVADVPEEYAARVHIGQHCEARFFGLPDKVFTGEVRSIAPVLSPERRTLRVLFFVDDLHDELRPGMFADIGLGTHERDALMVPAVSVIHIGREDYVLVAAQETNTWRVAEVEVGDEVNGRLEVFRGLESGNRVIAQGAILLKPAAAAAVQWKGEARQLSSVARVEELRE